MIAMPAVKMGVTLCVTLCVNAAKKDQCRCGIVHAKCTLQDFFRLNSWVIVYTNKGQTFRGDVGPLGVREGVLALSYPLLHPGRDGCPSCAVERWEPTQPVWTRREGEGVCFSVCSVYSW